MWMQATAEREAAVERFTPSQLALAAKLRDPESNDFVFRALVESRVAGTSPLFQEAYGRYIQRQFDIFQVERPGESFLEAIIEGTAPDGFNELPGFEDTN